MEAFAPGEVLLGRYTIEATLGVGGYGVVLRAHDMSAGRKVAIKVLRADRSLDEENLERFDREARAISQLKSKHVVAVYDLGRLDDGAPYMVMELLEGRDLGALGEPLPVARAAAIVREACAAVAEAHARGIVHRDLKPTNLFLARAPDGREVVKVLDFGISKTVTEDVNLTHTSSLLGTPAYMSPEQMRSARDVDSRTDIWALGAVLFELVEGVVPFLGESFADQVVKVSLEPPAPMVRAPELAGVIARCLAKKPDDRYQTARELSTALVSFTVVAAKPRRRGLAIAIAAVVVVAGAGITYAVTRGDAPPPPHPVLQPTISTEPPADTAPQAPPPSPPDAASTPAPPPPPPPPTPPKPQPKHTKPVEKKCDPFDNPSGHCRR